MEAVVIGDRRSLTEAANFVKARATPNDAERRFRRTGDADAGGSVIPPGALRVDEAPQFGHRRLSSSAARCRDGFRA